MLVERPHSARDLFMQILKDVPGFLMKLRNYFDEYCTRDVTTLRKRGTAKLNVTYIDLNCNHDVWNYKWLINTNLMFLYTIFSRFYFFALSTYIICNFIP